MQISILTLFPEMFAGPLNHSIVKIAQEKKFLIINLINIRDFGIGKHKTVDDTSYGGGTGMILRPDVLYNAIQHAKTTFSRQWSNEPMKQSTILLSASGKKFNQSTAKQLTILDHLILICGHYEGVDERVKHFIDDELSIGDFVLTGGELPAMLITDSITRLLPGVLKPGVTDNESFSLQNDTTPLLEYPQYTKPHEFQNLKVPEILLSGHHQKIQTWRLQKSREATQKNRPDLKK